MPMCIYCANENFLGQVMQKKISLSNITNQEVKRTKC